MKNLFYLSVVVLVFFFSCETETPPDYVILSGIIENPNSDSIYVLDGFGNELYNIALDKDNRFNDTVTVSTGLYMLGDGKEVKEIFLKPGFELNIFIDTKEFDETVKYTGIGAKENNYLANKFLLQEGFGSLPYTLLDEEESRFLEIYDSLFEIKNANFNLHQDFDEDFAYFESNTLKYERLQTLSYYETNYRFASNNPEFKVSENFTNTYENWNLNDEKLISIPYYLFYIEVYLDNIIAEKIKSNDTTDYLETTIETIDEIVSNKKLKEKLVYNTAKWSLSDTKNIEKAYKKINSFIDNPAYKKEIEEIYLTLKKTAKGEPSPLFNFVDINGQMVSLASLMGSVVYIDIWATWCGPCIDEIPSLKKLSNELLEKNIKFVSICTSDTKERWEKMVKEKELTGIQLFAASEKEAFFQAYVLQGIPRFIIIDKEGKIVDANAIRPSNPNLKGLLEKLI